MADRQETIADIIAEMKREAAQIFPALPIAVLQLATRLEAAHRRERKVTKPAENVNSGASSDTAGNCAKLREALVKCQGIALQWQADEIMGVAGSIEKPESRSASEALIDIEFVANAALAAPPRNCDVGTAEEQDERFAEYCESEVCKRKRCKFSAQALCIERCALVWAQMPYAQEGGAK